MYLDQLRHLKSGAMVTAQGCRASPPVRAFVHFCMMYVRTRWIFPSPSVVHSEKADESDFVVQTKELFDRCQGAGLFVCGKKASMNLGSTVGLHMHIIEASLLCVKEAWKGMCGCGYCTNNEKVLCCQWVVRCIKIVN